MVSCLLLVECRGAFVSEKVIWEGYVLDQFDDEADGTHYYEAYADCLADLDEFSSIG